MEGLTIGRMVHYVHPGTRMEFSVFAKAAVPIEVPDSLAGQHEAAIIVSVVDAEKAICNLFVIEHSTLAHGRPEVPYSEAREPGTWHWIERA